MPLCGAQDGRQLRWLIGWIYLMDQWVFPRRGAALRGVARDVSGKTSTDISGGIKVLPR